MSDTKEKNPRALCFVPDTKTKGLGPRQEPQIRICSRPLLLLSLAFIISICSLLDQCRQLFAWRTSTFQYRTVIRREHERDHPSRGETETWSRYQYQYEWEEQLYSKYGLPSEGENRSKLSRPRVLFMGDAIKAPTREARNSTNILEMIDSLVMERHYFNKAAYALDPVPSECIPMASWQTKQFPTCNIVHEFDFESSVRRASGDKKSYLNHQEQSMQVKILGKGGARIAWSAAHGLSVASRMPPTVRKISSKEALREKHSNKDARNEVQLHKEEVIFKTLKWARDYTHRAFEHNRVDALVSERLTSSPYVIDIYGFCGNTAINEMASGESMDDIAKHNPTSFEVLKVMTEAAYGIADIHSIDCIQNRAYMKGKGLVKSGTEGEMPCNSTVVHNDLGPSNFLVGRDGKMKISDFNLSILQYWNVTDNTQCKFYNKHPCGVHGAMASPESCKMKGLTEKIDVYSLGAVIFFTLHKGQEPFSFNRFDLTEQELRTKRKKIDALKLEIIKRNITNGVSPDLSPTVEKAYRHENEPAVRTLVHLMRRAMKYKSRNRPSARSIAKELHIALEELTGDDKVRTPKSRNTKT